MTLLLSLLMVGVAAAAEQPQPIGRDQVPAASVAQMTAAPAVVTTNRFALPQSRNPFVAKDHAKPALDAQDESRDAEICFTMRSYYFEREDDQAMQFVGMTKCDPGRAVTQKHVRGRARLVPAN
jgi:hypothetical protein